MLPLRRLPILLLCGCLLPLASTSSFAQQQTVQQPRSITNSGAEVAAESRQGSTPSVALPQSMTAAPTPGEPVDPGAEFDIMMLQSRIWNPNTSRFDNVEHRGYVDRRNPQPAGNLYQAPLVEAKPGETVRINFRNLLPPEPECGHTATTMNDPDKKKCYNDTNNHFHGGWVSPDGISDNVMRTLPPNSTHLYEYEYNIPQEHPAGTFWYHPHVHGSTAIQVGSGMAGAIIIRGDRWPRADAAGQLAPGDIDVLLRHPDGTPIPDKIFLLQQIQYACRVKADGTPKPDAEMWTCAADELGKLDSYKLFLNPGPQWDASGRFTTVNGAVGAPLQEHAVVGKPERWRFIHGGISDTIRLQVFPRKQVEVAAVGSLTLFERTPAAEQDAVIREVCDVDGDPVGLFEIATDGLTRPSVLATNERFMQPGYRSDLLMYFSKPGEYCVIDGAVTPNQGIPGSLDTRRLLFTVTVDPAAGEIPEATDAINGLLSAAVEASPLTGELKARVLAEVSTGNLASFAPHASLAAATIDNIQHVAFALGGGVQTDAPNVPLGAGIGYRRTGPGAPAPTPGIWRYSDNPLDAIQLTLGDVDEWRLKSNDAFAGHPFHIHVNPFEIMAVNKNFPQPDGTTVTRDLTVQNDIVNGQEVPSEYFGMKGAFKDVIFTAPGAEVVLRSTYKRYTGTFVIHCHILYHEDIGMMRKVIINDPGRGNVGAVQASAPHGQH